MFLLHAEEAATESSEIIHDMPCVVANPILLLAVDFLEGKIDS